MRLRSLISPCFAVSMLGAAGADGPLTAWGSNEAGQCNIPANLGAVHSAFGGALFDWGTRGYSVALRPDGSVAAWGATWPGSGRLPPRPAMLSRSPCPRCIAWLSGEMGA